MLAHTLYLGVFRPTDATLKRWQAPQNRFRLVIFLVVLGIDWGRGELKQNVPSYFVSRRFSTP